VSKKRLSARGERRAGERAAKKLVRAKEELALLEAGGGPERPIEVDSSSVIEVRARSMRCPLCEGGFQVEDHTAEGGRLRAVHVRCARCGVARRIWFRIGSALPD
jgi:hypothetical protein